MSICSGTMLFCNTNDPAATRECGWIMPLVQNRIHSGQCDVENRAPVQHDAVPNCDTITDDDGMAAWRYLHDTFVLNARVFFNRDLFLWDLMTAAVRLTTSPMIHHPVAEEYRGGVAPVFTAIGGDCNPVQRKKGLHG